MKWQLITEVPQIIISVYIQMNWRAFYLELLLVDYISKYLQNFTNNIPSLRMKG